MRKTVEFAAVFVLVASVTLAGCTVQSPTTISDGPATAFFAWEPAPGFDVVRRDIPLSTELSVTRVVGPEGALVELDGAGVALEIPAGALLEPTAITIRALAGDAAAVRLEPHDLRLAEPARLIVRVEGTSGDGLLDGIPDGAALPLFLGVEFRFDDGVDGAEPIETLPAEKDDGAVSFQVRYLSGYATASG